MTLLRSMEFVKIYRGRFVSSELFEGENSDYRIPVKFSDSTRYLFRCKATMPVGKLYLKEPCDVAITVFGSVDIVRYNNLLNTGI